MEWIDATKELPPESYTPLLVWYVDNRNGLTGFVKAQYFGGLGWIHFDKRTRIGEGYMNITHWATITPPTEGE